MAKTIKDIKEEFEELDSSNTQEINILIEKYKDDSRVGVVKLVNRYIRIQKERQDEIERSKEMFAFDQKYGQYELICGIDEVGRGPLAGPVMAAAVILPKDCDILYLDDSKKISEKRRELLYDEIIKKSLAYGIGSVSPEEIDEINILQATYKAMRKAISDLKLKPDLALVDAETIPNIDIEQVSIVKGDSKSASIAAASILAKVTRDRMMVAYDKVYSHYNFESNKGYGSKEHVDAIKKYGPCHIHRRSFIKNFI